MSKEDKATMIEAFEKLLAENDDFILIALKRSDNGHLLANYCLPNSYPREQILDILEQTIKVVRIRGT